MVDLKAIPYCLKDEDIKWVENTIAGMTDEEKVGQLFFQLTQSFDDAYIKELMDKYHLGGCRYNPAPGVEVQEMCRKAQTYAKVPVFVACNTEQGGQGACGDGSYIGQELKIAATDNADYAYNMGKCANEEAASIGCNMAFAPIVDILYNWENTEVINRCFGNDPKRVAAMGKAYMDGVHTIDGYACCAKHFPGNGQDFRDAHTSNNVNYFTPEHWDETYGMVYKTLIDGGLDAIMGGHILLPEYVRALKPGITDDEQMPGTLSYEIMTTLLRDKLGFNGMVVTDASHMVGMTDRMKRKDMLPTAINAGCDMFLFFNDPDEDFNTMLNAYKTGIISEARMTEALTRILGLKAKMGMHKKTVDELVPAPEVAKATVGKQESLDLQKKISDDCITLVKYKDQDVLPITPEKYRRIMIVNLKSESGSMVKLMKLFGMGGGPSAGDKLKEKLEAKGFEVFIFESPLDKITKQMEAGEKVDANIYFAGKNAIADFTAQMDLVITLCDITGRPQVSFTKGGGELPWYVFEVPVIGVGCNQPTMLADFPMLRTYINTYDSKDTTLDALVDKLMTGPEAFTGVDPIDSFCGLFDARL